MSTDIKTKYSSPAEKIELFLSLFLGRTDVIPFTIAFRLSLLLISFVSARPYHL